MRLSSGLSRGKTSRQTDGLPKTKGQRQEGPESSQLRWFDLMLPLP